MKKTFLIVFAVLLMYSLNLCSVSASEVEAIPLLEEIDLPDDLDFKVNSSCSKHAYFLQASANSLGRFAVYSRHVNYNDDFDYDFKKAYIDIYNPDGTFLQELSFFTTSDFAFCLESNFVKIYFYNFVLVYDLGTQELTCFAIPNASARNGGMYDQLRQRKFSAGEWQYECKKGFNGYIKLTRSNNVNKQVLLEMPGSDALVLKVILPGGIVGLVFMMVCSKIRKRKAQRHHQTDDSAV